MAAPTFAPNEVLTAAKLNLLSAAVADAAVGGDIVVDGGEAPSGGEPTTPRTTATRFRRLPRLPRRRAAGA